MVAPTVTEISAPPEPVTLDPFVADLTPPRVKVVTPFVSPTRRRRIYD